jgi:hypothetical protein
VNQQDIERLQTRLSGLFHVLRSMSTDSPLPGQNPAIFLPPRPCRNEQEKSRARQLGFENIFLLMNVLTAPPSASE